MGSKILTISIAAYNMEKYIHKTLDSLIDKRVIDDIEVFVIDDGGTDGTLDIANKYAEKYPNSIFPIHKENGGYGSTVNYSVAHATGKYFKLLDGDDWFGTEGAVKLVQYLKKSSVDMVVTPYYAGTEVTGLKLNNIDWLKKNTVLETRSLRDAKPIPMWAAAFKTEIVKKEWINLPEKTFYTDVLYLLHTLFHAKTLFCTEYGVYCYRVDRSGNSTNRISLAKHYPKHMEISLMCAEYYAEKMKTDDFPLLRACAGMPYVSAARGLLYAPVSQKLKEELIEYDGKLKSISSILYDETEKYGKTGKYLKWIRRTNYVAYWLMVLYSPKKTDNFKFRFSTRKKDA